MYKTFIYFWNRSCPANDAADQCSLQLSTSQKCPGIYWLDSALLTLRTGFDTDRSGSVMDMYLHPSKLAIDLLYLKVREK